MVLARPSRIVYTAHMTWHLDAEHTLGKSLRVRRYMLPNGLRIVLSCDRSAPIFSYQTWYRVGSRHEQPGATGMAHFFEHLMFGETAQVPTGEFDRLIEAVGGDNNAATWRDWTYYRTSLPAKELDLAIRLESDRMCHLTLSDEQVETERGVVMSERAEQVDDDIDGFLDEQLCALAYRKHPYGWPTIGHMADIRSLDRTAIDTFYRTYYAPNNAIVVVVGDIDEDRTLATIARAYGDIPAADIPASQVVLEPDQSAPRLATFTRPVAAERLLVGYKIPGQGHPDWAVADFISALLCSGPSSRLYRRLVVDSEMASSVDCGVPPFRDPALFRFSVNLARSRSAAEAIDAIDAELQTLARSAVPALELAKVKNGIETDFWAELEDCDGKAENFGHFEATLGDFRQLFAQAERLARVTADDIQRVAATYLQPELRTVVVARPSGSEAS